MATGVRRVAGLCLSVVTLAGLTARVFPVLALERGARSGAAEFEPGPRASSPTGSLASSDSPRMAWSGWFQSGGGITPPVVLPLDGTVVSGTSVPNVPLRFAFPGSPGDRVVVKVSGNGSVYPYVVDPFERNVAAVTSATPAVLTVAGTHQVVLNFGATPTTVSVQAWLLGADPSATLPTDGSPVSLLLAKPGQRLLYSFNAAAGQRFTFDTDVGPYSYGLIDPVGSTMSCVVENEPFRAPIAGIYKLV